MQPLITKATRFLFFAGKGGVGKTSMSCMVSVALAEKGKRVLLISTDPASNLDEVLETDLSNKPEEIKDQPGLWAMNIDPAKAAAEYRESIVAPYRGVLPDEAVQSIEEQLSGACSVEIASFNEFARLIGDERAIMDYDHVVLDTAPTGHTLRLLSLPSAWNDFIIENKTGSSCLGPLSGLKEQRLIYEEAVNSLSDGDKTMLLLVARAEEMAFKEAARASVELGRLGMNNQYLVINGVFKTTSEDRIARAFARKSQQALTAMPVALSELPCASVSFNPHGLIGLKALRETACDMSVPHASDIVEQVKSRKDRAFKNICQWNELLDQLAERGAGLIMSMGKGGVGKTSIAAAIAIELAERGYAVQLSTTDPAAHVEETVGDCLPHLHVSRIDPKFETERYVNRVLEENRGSLSAGDMALLEEELRSPCIEEIAVFQAFAEAVAQGHDRFMVLDTAPTGHTLLLLDATEAYHREVAQSSGDVSEAIKELLPRLRNPDFTKVLLITVPEATPVHEAQRLQEDLRRAQIEPFAWIINQSFALSGTTDPLLLTRGLNELKYIEEVTAQPAVKAAASPWLPHTVKGRENLKQLISQGVPE